MKNLLNKKPVSTYASSSTEGIDETSESKIPQNQKVSSSATGTFGKIDPKAPVARPRRPVNKKMLFGALGVVALLVILVVFFGVLPVQQTVASAKELNARGREMADALKNQDLAGAKAKLPEVRQQLSDTQAKWNNVWLLRVVPLANAYHQDGVRALNAAKHGLDAVDTTINALEPYADLLGFKGGSQFVAGSADERIQLAVATLDKVTPKIAEIGKSIELLKQEVDAIDPNRYPESFNGTSIRPKIVEGKEILDDTVGLFLNAQPLLEVLPQLLGEPDPKRYLVIFQNDKELRPTGGFMTAYAIFKVDQGKFLVEKSDDIYELDDQIRTKTAAPKEILTYHKGVYYFNIRDSNLSPDFAKSVETFKDLYPNKYDFDGIIAVDTHVLVESIKILGTFVVKGRTFSAETDPRCDCPRVIYELEDYATRPVAYVREDRKDVLGELLLQIMKKALGVSPSQYWGQLFQMAISEINQKHILAYMEDEKAQKGIESLNMGGRIAGELELLGYKDGQNWDYLHINDANMAGAKSNLFVEHTVTQDYSTENDGTIVKKVTIDYKNPAPPSDCNLESGGLCLNGILRNWVRIYVPKGSTLVESKGSQSPKDESSADLLVSEDLGKTIFEGFLTVRPLGSGQLTFTYKLPFKKTSGPLPFLLQKQPGTEGHEYLITVNGKQKEKFDLTHDLVVNLNL